MSRQRHEAPRALGREARELLASARRSGGPPPGAKARVRASIAVALASGAVASVGAASAGAAKTLASSAGGVSVVGASAAGGTAIGAAASSVAIAGGVGFGVKVALAVVALAVVGGALVQLAPSREGGPAPRTEAVASPEIEVIDPVTDTAPAIAPSPSAPDALAPEMPDELALVVAEPAIERAVVRRSLRLSASEVEPTEAEPELAEAALADAELADAELADAELAEGTPAAPASTLMEEMALLSPARAALARGDSEAARELVVRYRARYPSGAFAEEFAAIDVQALCASGDPSAPASRARFERSHPGSTYTARLARACD